MKVKLNTKDLKEVFTNTFLWLMCLTGVMTWIVWLNELVNFITSR